MSARLTLDELLSEELAAEKAAKVRNGLHETETIVLQEPDKTPDPFFAAMLAEKPDFYLEDQADEDPDAIDPAYADWCIPAQLKNKVGTPFLGIKYLQETHDSESEDSIAKAIHKAIYLTEKQEANSHDRPMMDVPKDGRRKGGTHGLALDKRRVRYAKIVNESLVCTALVQIPGEDDVHESDRIDREEVEQNCIGTNAKLRRQFDYCLSIYTGKYPDILALLAQLKTNSEIAKIVGKTDRRIRQIVNGHAPKDRVAQPGLRQICREIVANGVPSDFQSAAPTLVPVIVQPVHTLKKSLQKSAVMGQLGWDFDAVGEAA